jgi:hypothetical protein
MDLPTNILPIIFSPGNYMEMYMKNILLAVFAIAIYYLQVIYSKSFLVNLG